ncbi:MAG: hypothetical protein NTX50_19605 [Candidatus Sumerlaeota bacterium]|nr:hypothetical protein [Candidatus Sumerlaeota bacterium]
MPRGKKSLTLSQLKQQLEQQLEEIESYESMTVVCEYLEGGAALAKGIQALNLANAGKMPVGKRMKAAAKLKNAVAAHLAKAEKFLLKKPGRQAAPVAAPRAKAPKAPKAAPAAAPAANKGKRLTKAMADAVKKAIISVLTEAMTPMAKSELVKKVVMKCGVAAKQARNVMIGMKREKAILPAGFGKYTVKQA